MTTHGAHAVNSFFDPNAGSAPGRLAGVWRAARAQLESLLASLASNEARTWTHRQVEDFIAQQGNEVLRLAFQGHLDQRGTGDVGPSVRGADGVRRTHKRVRSRALVTRFGKVEVQRTGYSARGVESLHPLDAQLNLPPERYSHGVCKRAAKEAARNSFDEVVDTVAETTAAKLPKRQAEQQAARAAAHFEEFYEQRRLDALDTPPKDAGDIVVLTVDQKGVVMRHEDLREETRKAAESRDKGRERKHKHKRLSKGQKRCSKRMAAVAAVYTVEPFARTAEEIIGELRPARSSKKKRPKPRHKRVWASVTRPLEEVVPEMFEEALARDPDQKKRWVALVDGNKQQIRLLKKWAREVGVKLVIVLDIIHVIEYLWKAGHAFFGDGSRETEPWVTKQLLGVLNGRAGIVAGAMLRKATARRLKGERLKAVEKCAGYLKKYRAHLRYDEYLAAGLPIATGVVEGACRYLVRDRMDITGARWSLEGAEAVLKLRALHTGGDFDEYWEFHEERELEENHLSRYASPEDVIIQAA